MSEFGGFTPSLRWNNETGVLAYVELNEIFEKEIREIELNSQAATFVVDMRTIEKGKGRIATGIYKMYLVPLRQELPPLPSEELSHTSEYKAALGVNLWNPRFGLVRIETTSAYVRAALGRIIQEYDRAEEAREGLLPVIRFVAVSRPFRVSGTSTIAPLIFSASAGCLEIGSRHSQRSSRLYRCRRQ